MESVRTRKANFCFYPLDHPVFTIYKAEWMSYGNCNLSLTFSRHIQPSQAFPLQISKSSNKFAVYCCKSSEPIIKNGIFRRDIVLFGVAATVATMLPIEGSGADEDIKMAPVVDELNAYSYLIPLELPSKKFSFKWVESRKPERYSSAAPLSPNARLRIVSERVDFIDNLILSITIGPPNPTFLKSTDKSTWAAKDVADSVLSDKSALRVTSSQRMAESSVLDAHTSEIEGERYWYYEYLVRKSPTKTVQDSNIFRHYLAASVERDGFLYSLNASTLNKQWDMMGPVLEKTVASFRLLPPSENYVPPYKDPWRFCITYCLLLLKKKLERCLPQWNLISEISSKCFHNLLFEEMIHRNNESPLISTHLTNVREFLYAILFLLLVAAYLVCTHFLFVFGAIIPDRRSSSYEVMAGYQADLY
ncbi:hypothetical protein R6Q57_016651 [Mikania cordata]